MDTWLTAFYLTLLFYLPLLAGWLLDRLLGDPVWLPHIGRSGPCFPMSRPHLCPGDSGPGGGHLPRGVRALRPG